MPFVSKSQQRYMYSKAHDGKIPVETVQHWSHETKKKPGGFDSLPDRIKMAADKAETLSLLQRLIPGLVLGAAGAGYGALQSPGGSRVRGAVIGGAAGAGAGLGLETARTFIQSPHGSHMGTGGNTAATFGGAALGGLGGLHAGRELAEYLSLGDRKDDTEDDLSELDARRSRSWLPSGLSEYLSTDNRKHASAFVTNLTKQASTLPYALGGVALGGLAGAYMTGDGEDGRAPTLGRRLRNGLLGAGIGGLGGAGLSMLGGAATAAAPVARSFDLPRPADSNGVDAGVSLTNKPQASVVSPPAIMPSPNFTSDATQPENRPLPQLKQQSDSDAAAAVKRQATVLRQQNNRNHIHPRAATSRRLPTHAGGVTRSDMVGPLEQIKPPVPLQQLPQTPADVAELLSLPQLRQDNAMRAIPKPTSRTWQDAWKQYWQ